jgi:hypothetical protein
LIHVPRKLTSPDEPGSFFAEASTLGWAPGFFPEEIMYGRTRMVRFSLTDSGAIYGSVGRGRRNINLIVWND